MTQERFKVIPAVHVFFVRDGQILMLRRLNTGYEDGNYSVPAGHVDGGELICNAAAREVRKETTIVVELDDLRLIHTMHVFANDGERVNFFFAPADWTGEPANAEPDKCDDLNWFPLDQLPSHTVPYVRAAFANFRAKVPYSEFGWQR